MKPKITLNRPIEVYCEGHSAPIILRQITNGQVDLQFGSISIPITTTDLSNLSHTISVYLRELDESKTS